jgi:hypothetical protein
MPDFRSDAVTLDKWNLRCIRDPQGAIVVYGDPIFGIHDSAFLLEFKN